MRYRQLIIALPCHSLEDFPLYHTGESAEGLLANWTSLWHPALIAAAEGIVTWCRCDTPPDDLAEKLLVIPSVGANELPTGFAQRAKEEGAIVIRKQSVRSEIVATALASLDGGDAGVSAELAADFFALGYAYLQVQVLTRQMRYASNLDEVHFKNIALEGATAAVSGDDALAIERLQAAFNLLAEERDRYYSVEAFLVDLTLVGPTTLGPTLASELTRVAAGTLPVTNVLLSGELLERLATEQPATLVALQAAVAAGRVGLVGGHQHEGVTPLLARETLLADLISGSETYKKHLGVAPQVYGRFRHGLAPIVPQLLTKLGYVGALHLSFEDGRIPEGSQTKIRWEGADGAAIDTLAKPPYDASKPETFLNLAVKLGESMDRDHVATFCLAHWPGQASVWYDDLRRVAKYCPALGKFQTLSEYFTGTDTPTQSDRHGSDQYRAPYLKQQVIRRALDPISSSTRYWQRQTSEQARQTLGTLAALVRGTVSSPSESLGQRIDDAVENPAANSDLDRALETGLSAAINDLAQTLPTAKKPAEQGYLVFNPCSFVRRLGLHLPELSKLPEVGRPIYAAGEAGSVKHVVVDVPPLGFAWIAPASANAKPAKKEAALVEGNVLRNEYFEVHINATTGALQSIHEYNARNNRLSQQIALRQCEDGDSDDRAVYSVMAADKVATTVASAAHAEITSSGRLLDRKGNILARFTQRFQIWRGSRVLRMEIELDPLTELKSDPWNSYYCLRWAWSDEAAELSRAVNETRCATDAKRFESPHYLELTDAKNRTTILTGGLPYHRRCEYRLLDTLLMVRGETERKFTVGVGVELAQPLHDAIGLMQPPLLLAREAPPPTPATSSWLFHLDSKNVLATHWSPLETDGRVRGFRVRLAEIAGRDCRVSLSAFRPLKSVQMLDFRGEPLGSGKVEDGKAVLELGANEWVSLAAEW